jgi:hypothetical protein
VFAPPLAFEKLLPIICVLVYRKVCRLSITDFDEKDFSCEETGKQQNNSIKKRNSYLV